MRQTVFGKIILVIGILLISGCHKAEPVIIEAPKISCGEMVITEGEYFDYQDYCTVEGNVTASKIDTNKVGEQKITITAEKNGGYTTQEYTVIVKKKECPENAHYVDDVCECDEGYERTGKGCEVVKSEESEENKTDQKDSEEEPEPEPTAQPEEQPTPEPAPQPTPEPEIQPQQPIYQPMNNGSIYFYPTEYGSFDAAFNACVAQCSSMGSVCECVPTALEDGYVLNY